MDLELFIMEYEEHLNNMYSIFKSHIVQGEIPSFDKFCLCIYKSTKGDLIDL